MTFVLIDEKKDFEGLYANKICQDEKFSLQRNMLSCFLILMLCYAAFFSLSLDYEGEKKLFFIASLLCYD